MRWASIEFSVSRSKSCPSVIPAGRTQEDSTFGSSTRAGRAQAALIGALHQSEMGSGPGKLAVRVRSDRDGRAVVPSSPGRWLIKAVQMQRAAGGSSVDWESIWTSLTFRVPSGR
jgi:hypothetical protein